MTIHRPPGQLPREARDTLVLLAVLAWTLLPQLDRVPLWCGAFALLCLAWRAGLAWRQQPLPRPWLRLLLLALLITLAWQSYRSLLGKEAGTALLVALTGLKSLELQARRDQAVAFGLGLFLVLANFLYSQSLLTALSMGVSVLGLLTTLVLAQMRAGRPPLRAALATVLRHAAIGAPLVALLFLLFPRIAPLWGVPGEAAGRTGLSDELALGTVAELASDDSLALRVRFLAPAQAASSNAAAAASGALATSPILPAPDQLYFRGPVLSRLDVQVRNGQLVPLWRAAEDGLAGLGRRPAYDVEVGGQAISYEMTLEPLRVATLPLLEMTVEPPDLGPDAPALRRGPELTWTSRRPLGERVRLQARAWTSWREPAGLPPPQASLVLPARVFPRTQAWARAFGAQWQARNPGQGAGTGTSASTSPLARADALAVGLIQHISRSNYVYTLAPPPVPPGADALDDFWLDQRQGFCEHYAVAFVVVMRSQGVPARLVTGYQGGRLNPVDGLLEVRQSDAHAWVEYWRDGLWVRADPTAAVAPERVRQNLRLRPPPGLVVDALGRFDAGLARDLVEGALRLRQLWGAAEHRWNVWVLDHDRQRQFELLRRLGWQTDDPLELGRALLIGLAGLGLAGAAWAAWDGRRRRPGSSRPRDPWQRGWQGLQDRLRAAGLDLPAAAGPGLAAAWIEANAASSDAPVAAGERNAADPARQELALVASLAAGLRALDAWRYAPPPVAATGSGTDPQATAGRQAALARQLRELRRGLASWSDARAARQPVAAGRAPPWPARRQRLLDRLTGWRRD